MKITYHRKGDYLYPDLTLEEEEVGYIGKYGLMRKDYLCEHNRPLFTTMLMTGKLNRHLTETEAEAQQRVDRILEELQKTNPAPDKEADQLAWAAYMNSLTAQAEEIVIRELICC